MNDAEYMRLALALAEQGRGWTAPNPMVGAVRTAQLSDRAGMSGTVNPTRSGTRWHPAPPTPPEPPCM